MTKRDDNADRRVRWWHDPPGIVRVIAIILSVWLGCEGMAGMLDSSLPPEVIRNDVGGFRIPFAILITVVGFAVAGCIMKAIGWDER